MVARRTTKPTNNQAPDQNGAIDCTLARAQRIGWPNRCLQEYHYNHLTSEVSLQSTGFLESHGYADTSHLQASRFR